MAEETVLEQEQKTDTADVSSLLQQAAFGDNAPSHESNADVKIVSETKTTVETKTEDEEIIEPKEWLKREFDIDDVAILKAEREELKSVKEKLKTYEVDENGFKVLDYLKPENEDKLFEHLSNKRKVVKLTSVEVSESNAADIVKFQMQQKYKDSNLSIDDIDYKFSKQFGIPKEPQEDKFDTTAEYEEAKSEWENKVSEIKRELLIEAKLAIPEIQKLKTELILPNIEREVTSKKEPTAEELLAFENGKKSFIQAFDNVFKDFNGISTQVKDKDVDYPVAYITSQEEKNLISAKMQKFVDSGFNANVLLADMWENADGSLNIQQMTEDLSRMLFGKNSDAKIANEAANKRLELYFKEKRQIDIKEGSEEGKLQLDKGDEKVEDKLRERMLAL